MKTNWTAVEKRQLIIFGLVAFVLPYLLGIPMGLAYHAGSDVSAFPSAQMFYPAAGAILAILLTRREDKTIPRKFYICFLLVTVLMALCALASAIAPALPWAAASNGVIMVGSVLCWVFYFLDGKARRTAWGMRLNRWVFAVFAVFAVLYFVRIVLLSGLMILVDPTLAKAESTSVDPLYFTIMLVNMPLNFLLVYTAFFGEEYGWRGFLQPLLQKRFALRGGILVLGVAWGLWHLPINIFFYSPATWGLSVVNQIVLCICYSVFFGFAYMKTKSIWAPVLIHFFNNNAITLFTDPNAIQNQVLDWTSVLLGFVVLAVLYLPFFASRVFRTGPVVELPRPAEAQPAISEQPAEPAQ